MPLLMVFSTFPDANIARQVATTLVEERLVACVNLLPGVESIYQWEGKMESSQEVLAIMKTMDVSYETLELRIKQLHPYEVPEIVAVPAERVQEGYLRWVVSMTGAKSE